MEEVHIIVWATPAGQTLDAGIFTDPTKQMPQNGAMVLRSFHGEDRKAATGRALLYLNTYRPDLLTCMSMKRHTRTRP